MYILISKKQWIAALLCVVFILGAGSAWLYRTMARPAFFHPASYSTGTLILDAGHGGEDGGAESADGQAESGLNLAIALRTEQLAGLFGVDTAMTRREDISLYSEGEDSLREKKKSDLKNRAVFINAVEDGVLISIHQNKFPDTSLQGAQVFYADEESSLAFAAETQEILRAVLDDTNRRKAAKIPKTVYLMNHITCPGILVECGFLSNPGEAELLKSDTYQKKIALSLCIAYLGYQETRG